MTRSRTALLAGALSTATVLFLFSWTGAVQAHVIERVSLASDGTQGNADSDSPSISADGRYVAFESRADNLVPGDTNGVETSSSTTGRQARPSGERGQRRELRPNRQQSDTLHQRRRPLRGLPSEATNLVPGDTNGRVDVFVRDRQTGTTERVSVASAGSQAERP